LGTREKNKCDQLPSQFYFNITKLITR
jgi:hypothetical protein